MNIENMKKSANLIYEIKNIKDLDKIKEIKNFLKIMIINNLRLNGFYSYNQIINNENKKILIILKNHIDFIL